MNLRVIGAAVFAIALFAPGVARASEARHAAHAQPGWASGITVSQSHVHWGHRTGFSPQHPAPIVPARAVVVSQTATGFSTTVVYRFGVRIYHVTYFLSGRFSYIITGSPVGVRAASVSRAAPVRRAVPIAPPRRASIVPARAVIVSSFSNGGTTSLTYRLGIRFYHVTYFPNGRFSYLINLSPASVVLRPINRSPVTVPSSAPPTTGRLSPVLEPAKSVISVMPRAGGGDAPGVPTLPALLGLGLTVLGVLLRRWSSG